MTKKVISVLALCLVLVWSVMAFGSSTPKYNIGKNRVQDLVPWSGSQTNEANAVSSGRAFGQPYSVGVSASPGTAVGNTYYDYQHNGSGGRQVGQYAGKIKMSWMDQNEPQISPGRRVKWNIVSVTGSPATIGLDNGGTVDRLPVAAPVTFDGTPMAQDQAGYTNMVVRNNGKSVLLYHAVGAWASWGAGVDGSVDNGIFTSSPAPQFGGFADTAIWPHACYQQDGTDTLLHVVAVQSANGALTDQRFYYWRGHINGVNVTWDPAILVDSVSVNSPVIEASRVDRKVAIVYTRPRVLGTQVNNDVVYKLSTDAGGSGLAYADGYTNVTNYVDASTERAYTDCAAVFDNDGDLHIVWNTLYNDPVDGLAWMPVNLNHWDATNGIRTITTADWQNTCDQIYGGFRGGTFNLNIAKPQVVVKPVGAGIGPAADSEYIYAIWTQFGPDTLDCATQADGTTLGGQVNSELWCSVSSDNGNTWDRPQNITGTRTPDCAPGNCHSEHWSSAAPVADSGIYLTYVDDTHAGGVVRDDPVQEGAWTNSPYMAYAVFTRDPVSEPRIGVGPKLNFVELNVAPGGSDNIVLTISNVGNAQLDYTVAVTADDGGQSHVVVEGLGTYSNSIAAAGAPQNLTVTYDGLGLGDPEERNWRIEVTSNDAANDPNQGGTAISVNLNVFISTIWFTCVADTISTGQHRLSVGSCLELGDGGNGGGLFSYADSSEYVFDMSPVVAWNDGAQNLVYRDILLNSLAERSRDSNKAFRAQSAISVSRGASTDVATGKAYTTDSIIALDYEVTTYKDPGAQKGFVAKYTITNVTGATYNGVHFGVAADLDVDSMSSANDGIADATIQYVGARGGYRDSTGATTAMDKYAAVFYIPLDATCSDLAVGGQVLDNVDYVYPENGYNTDSLYNVMNGMSGWNSATLQADTISDVNVVMVDQKNVTLAANDTVQMAFGVAVSDVSEADLAASIGLLRYNANNACALCPITATGDVNNNGSITSADIIYLVGFVFKGGPAPLPCAASGDVNCNGSVTSADIIYLVGFVFKGGNPPCDVCTLIPGTWTCP